MVINSPEVSFGITKQLAQVGHKNINIFSYEKIIYADSAELENNLYKKIYNITLCNFWHII
jgi:hypothetical protein